MNSNHIRQTGLIDPANLTSKVAIIGAGGIGSWTSLALLKMGLPSLHIIDFDEVEEANLGSQLYTITDIGQKKAEALKQRLEILTSTIATTEIDQVDTAEKVKIIANSYDIIINAVDNMVTRNLVFQTLKGQAKLLIDGRMAGNVIQIFIVQLDNLDSIARYEQTLFTDDEASIIPCTERAVVYNTFMIGGIMADLIAQKANNRVLPHELELDLTNLTLFKEIEKVVIHE